MMHKGGKRRWRTVWQAMVAIFLLPWVTEARLGESISKCDQRYGNPLKLQTVANRHVRRYEKRSYEVRAVFVSGRAVEVIYRRLDGAPLSERELDLFLLANSDDSAWQRVSQVAEWKAANRGREQDPQAQQELLDDLASFYLWTREDGKAEASYDRREGILFLADAAHLAIERSESNGPNAREPTTGQVELGF
jgi:hypothetical protein